MSGSSASEMSSLTDKNRCEGGADKSSVSAKRAGCMDSREPDYEYDPSFRNPHPRLWKTIVIQLVKLVSMFTVDCDRCSWIVWIVAQKFRENLRMGSKSTEAPTPSLNTW